MTTGTKLTSLAVLATLLCCTTPVAAKPRVTVEKNALGATDGKDFAFKINMPQPGDVSLKVYDANGKFVRLVTQKYVMDEELVASWNLKDYEDKPVAPGAYAARCEFGLRLKLDKQFGTDGLLADKAFVSPAILRLDKQGNLYLLDTGAATLFKFNADGTPANNWDGKNTIAAPKPPYWGGIAVEPDGSRIYLSQTMTTSHVIDVYDGKTAARLFYIGAFFGQDAEWDKEKGGIVYPHWLGLNGDNKIYSDSPGYGRVWAFDRRKEGKAGGVWQLGGRANPRVGWDSPGDCGDTDGSKAIYMASYEYHKRAQLFKIVDEGHRGQFAYGLTRYDDPRSKKEKKDAWLNDIYGIAYDGEQGLYVVERGSARILKIADTGFGFDVAATFGSRGKNAAKLEFIAPRSVAVSPDGTLLYVVEDGEPVSKKNTTIGQARIARYKIGYFNRTPLKVTIRPPAGK